MEKKNSSKVIFWTLEIVLAVIVIVLIAIMLRGNYGNKNNRVSVIIQNSNENQWTSFKYGVKMAAEDLGLDAYTVNTGALAEEQELQDAIEQEVQNGANAVIIQPVYGEQIGKMLQNMHLGIPVILAESAASEGSTQNGFAAVEPDQYAMGEDLAEELLADYEGNLNGKRLGIVAQSLDTQAGMNRRDGFCETIQDAGAEIVWTVSGLDLDNGEELLNAQTRADIVVALDNNSLVAAGSSANSGYLRGAVIYGIGHSADAVYYLDTGAVEALVIPDEFQQGYQSVAEIAKRLKNRFYRMETVTVEHTVLRREDLFSKENQEMLFMMSQ